MKIKDKISGMIHEAIDSFDFDEAIEEALDNINVEDLVHSRLSSKVDDINIESMIKSIVIDYIDEELDELDIDDEVLTALQDIFE